MRPILWQLGAIAVPGYAAMLAAGGCVFVWMTVVRSERDGSPRGRVALVLLLAYVAAMLGARLLFVAEHLDTLRDPWRSLLTTYPVGFTSLGGIIAGGLAGVWAAQALRLSLVPLVRAALPGLCVFGALGRVGCFLAGCCHGRPTALPWGVVFPPGSEAAGRWGAAVAVHPTQLYDAICLVMIGTAAYVVTRRPGPRVAVWPLILTYGLARFLTDSLRGDALRYGYLSLTQCLILALLATAAARAGWRAIGTGMVHPWWRTRVTTSSV